MQTSTHGRRGPSSDEGQLGVQPCLSQPGSTCISQGILSVGHPLVYSLPPLSPEPQGLHQLRLSGYQPVP